MKLPILGTFLQIDQFYPPKGRRILYFYGVPLRPLKLQQKAARALSVGNTRQAGLLMGLHEVSGPGDIAACLYVSESGTAARALHLGKR